MIIDHISNWKTYRLGPAWEKAFAFLQNLSADAAEQKYVIEGDDIFAVVMSYEVKEETSPLAKLEAHRRYADIQMALVDSERIAIYPTHSLKTKTAYESKEDLEFFEYPGKAPFQCSLHTGHFVFLLPQDAHMAGLESGNLGKVIKKVVVKIALDCIKLDLPASSKKQCEVSLS